MSESGMAEKSLSIHWMAKIKDLPCCHCRSVSGWLAPRRQSFDGIRRSVDATALGPNLAAGPGVTVTSSKAYKHSYERDQASCLSDTAQLSFAFGPNVGHKIAS